MTNSENYKAARARLDKAKTREELIKLDQSFTRLYDAGVLTPQEYMKLDTSIMKKMFK